MNSTNLGMMTKTEVDVSVYHIYFKFKLNKIAINSRELYYKGDIINI